MRAAQQQAKSAYNDANASANQYGEQGSQISSSLIPGLEREANNPQGFTPEEMNNQLVAGEQGVGGANAGITGQANLEAARSRNSSGQTAALDEAARDKTRQLSENALNIQNSSDKLGQEKQMNAQKELGGLYGTDVNANLEAQGLSTKDIEAETEAGKSGWFQNMTGMINSLGTVAKAIAECPARGSFYLLADGSEKLVEQLAVGDLIAGIDGEPETIEEIQSAIVPVLRIATDDGFVARNSRVHAFALPAGGFVVAMFSLGKSVRTKLGVGKIVSVQWDGDDEVFNVITDGSHTYRADGVWALGVGEAERHVSMSRWNEIGDRLAHASH